MTHADVVGAGLHCDVLLSDVVLLSQVLGAEVAFVQRLGNDHIVLVAELAVCHCYVASRYVDSVSI